MNIIERSGVSPVHNDTIRLAEIASNYHKNKILDMGTGTGYIAIHLAKGGAEVHATDINQDAISSAEENAKNNNVSIKVFYSNLFENISEQYELIVFNPPIGGVEPKWQTSIKALIRKSIFKNIVSKIISRLTQRKRLPFVKKFINESKKHLVPGGVLLLHLQSIDVPFLSEYKPTVIEKVFEHSSIVEIK